MRHFLVYWLLFLHSGMFHVYSRVLFHVNSSVWMLWVFKGKKNLPINAYQWYGLGKTEYAIVIGRRGELME